MLVNFRQRELILAKNIRPAASRQMAALSCTWTLATRTMLRDAMDDRFEETAPQRQPARRTAGSGRKRWGTKAWTHLRPIPLPPVGGLRSLALGG